MLIGDSMKCLRCQHENPTGSNFCRGCGAPLSVACLSCGAELPAGSRFCNKCGTPVGAGAVAAGPSPHSYTPKHLAEKILTSKSALEGERKQVTVLFCDIVESSKLAERLDAEQMHELMDRALRLMAQAVHRYEGTVNQFLGDGIMALFGAPIALEDHALRAVRAALAIQETISGYSAQLHESRGVAVRLRLGLNTGPVVVGRIGDDLRMDYTAVGDTTHVAARMQELAEPGSILISEPTQRLVEGYVHCEPMGTMQLQARDTPVSVFKVTGRKRARSRLELGIERGLTEFIGRRGELSVMHERLARAKAGQGQVVAIVAEPGAGKSRLLFEFRKALQGEEITWLEGHCEPYAQASPYLPILQILRANFQIEEGDNRLQAQEKLRHGVLALDPTLEGIVPFLRELLDPSGEDDALKHLEPQIKRRRTFEALLALTMAGSQRRPFIAVIEDVHWIDSTSEDYLAFLVDSMAAIPHLILTTHRPGYSVRWADKTYYRQISLDLLTEDEAQALAATLLGSRRLPPELSRIIWQKAEGNPLFVEEITASLLERGVVRRGEDLRWAGDASVDLPSTIQDIVRARIDRLAEPVKRTVQNAAVIGREFGLRLLTRISEMATEVEGYLDTLKSLEFIHQSRIIPELEFIFKHAVIQDVAYEGLLVQRRKEIHGAIGGAMEDLYADRLEENAALLAHHYARSDHQRKAFEYALIAGDRAARLHANTEAKTFYEHALAIARRLPSSPQVEQLQIDAILRLPAVGATRQDIDRDLKNLEHTRSVAERLADGPRLARVLYWIGRLRYILGDPETALAYATDSLEIADRLGDESLAAPAVNLMGRLRAFRADFMVAGQLLERSVAQMRVLGNKGEESTAAGLAGWVFGELGEFERARPYADQSVRLAQEIHDPFAEAAALLYRGLIGIASGDLARAKVDFADARRIAERVGDRIRTYLAAWLEGEAHTLAGDALQGRPLLEESLARAEQLGTKFFLAGPKSALAHCLIALGELHAARQMCQQAIEIARDTGDRFFGALANRALAEALSGLSPDDSQSAERAIEEAIRVQQEIGARPELARSCLCYARLLGRWNRTDAAASYRDRAIRMFAEMGMTWDLARAQQPARPGTR
jgi:class 3 adenylate cyclase/tetratricopeptide (TPR) repeat protein